jgi:hypothetical protein
MAFAFQGPEHRSRTRSGRPSISLQAFCTVALRLVAGALRCIAFTRFRQLHACAARLRKSDSDSLLGIGGAMLSFANVVHFFADKFAGLSAGRFAFFSVSLGAFNYFLFWHDMLLNKFEY